MQPSTPHTPASWDAASGGYAELTSRITEKYADTFVDRLEVDGDMEALEVAAGTGALTLALAPKVKSLLATDFAPKMVELLRERVQAAGAANVTCEVMDGQALAIDDARFDRAVCSFAMMLFPDRARGFSELRRVLRRGGRAAVSGWAGPDKFESFGLFLAALRVALPDLPPPPAPVFSLADPADFKRQMEAAGFTNVDIELVPRALEFEDSATLWKVLTRGAPPVRALLDRVGPGGAERIRGAFAEIVDRRCGGGPVRVTNVATLGHGVAG